MKWARARAATRASGGALAREIPIPLPLKGLYTEAKTSEVSGIYAGEFLNWESTGSSLRLRRQVQALSAPSTVLRRIPFEFGSETRYIEVHADRLVCGEASITRASSATCDVAYISGNAIIADGLGLPVRFDGTAFTQMSIEIAGVNPATFSGVIAHQDRLLFWVRGGTLDFYYPETVGAVSGNWIRFPLGRLGNITGSLSALRSMTIDAGHGMNDTLAVITTTGVIVAYEGLDPGDPNDWRLLTRVNAAAPLGGEAFTQVGADLWMFTASGVISLSDSIRQSVLALVGAVSAAISEEVTEMAATPARWQMHTADDGSMVVVNRIAETIEQFIFRPKDGSWAKADFPAVAWHNLGTATEFTADDGRLCRVVQAKEGDLIAARLVTGWFRMPRATGITFLKIGMTAASEVTVSITVLSDHQETPRDIREAKQTVVLETHRGRGQLFALDDLIPVDAVGETFKLIIELSAEWCELTSLRAGVL